VYVSGVSVVIEVVVCCQVEWRRERIVHAVERSDRVIDQGVNPQGRVMASVLETVRRKVREGRRMEFDLLFPLMFVLC
jgi:hypothetical protein